MIPYNTPYQNLVQLSIKPIGQTVDQSFISDGTGSINFFGGYIILSSTLIGGTYTASEGDTFTFDNEIFLFKSIPGINDLQAGAGLNRNLIQRLYQILKRHPRLSLKYNFFYTTVAGVERIDYSATISGNIGKSLDVLGAPTVPFFSGTITATSISNSYISIVTDLDNYLAQQDGYRGQIEVLTTDQIAGLESLTVGNPYRSLLLQRHQLGFQNGLQIPMEFDISLFMKQELSTEVQFGLFDAYLNNGALAKYQINYGDFYDNSNQFVDDFLNRYQVHNSYIEDLEPYQDRLPSTGLKTILPLSNRQNHFINPSQYNTISQIQHYVPFDLSEPILNFQNTNLQIKYDLEFEDGTTLIDQVQPTITLAANSGQFTQDISLNLINYQTLEGTSRIKSISFSVQEYLPVDLISNSRQVTESITFQLNNELRCYQVDDNDPINENNRNQTQLYYQNSYGGFDTLFTHESTLINSETASDTYQYLKLNKDVFNINTIKTFSISSDQLTEDEYKYVVSNLSNSSKIFIKMKDLDQTPCFIKSSTNTYNNQTLMHKQTGTVELKIGENNLTQ